MCSIASEYALDLGMVTYFRSASSTLVVNLSKASELCTAGRCSN
jgi:hypothetical protein